MSIRYKIERNYNFSPVLLSNGNKIAININETGNSCKIIYDPSLNKSNGYYSYEVIDSKDPKFIKMEKENILQLSLLTGHEENQVLKRRHYFDNSTAKSADPLFKYNDKKYTPNSCWELKSKTHSVQELSDKFEISNYNPPLYKSSSKLLEKRLAFLITGNNNKKFNFVNGFWRKSHHTEYPFRSQPIGINSSENSLNRSITPSKLKSWNHRPFDRIADKKINGSISKFSSTISIPIINQRHCYSSINVSGSEYIIGNDLQKNKDESNNGTLGSTKSMESLFINSQVTETIDIPLDESKKENINGLQVQDPNERSTFRENIIKIKSLLRPVDQNGSFKYKNVHRLKKKSNSLLDKKIMFFEKLMNSTRKRDEESVSSIHSKNSSIIDFDYSTVSLNDI